jgi:hypothetical protein
MISKFSIVPVALLALGGTQVASASNYDEGQWVTTFMAGSGLLPNGAFNPALSGNVADLGAIDPSLAGVAGTSTIDHMQFRDAFRAGPSFGIEMGYMTESNVEPFARLSYSQLRGRTKQIGNLNSTELDSEVPIAGDFGDMDSWSLNLGTRYFLSDNGTLRTYVAGYLGADRTDALHAHFDISGQPMSPREEILPQETRFDAGLEGGVAWQVSDNTDLSLSLGAQYIDARSERTDAFAPIGIDEVRFSEPKWSVPVNFGVNFKF